jgi:hypothetical protein|tara:strand:- start:716 stop:1168 length:453 start_codon:yes stop_codon:yes gene_type:complete
MVSRRFKWLAFFVLMALVGCARSSEKVPSAYISPLIYQDYNCKQIAAEMHRVTRRVYDTGAAVDDAAGADAMKMGVGLLLLWPTLFFVDGDGPEAAEYARLKGEFEALEMVSIQKECGLRFTNPDADRREDKKKTEEERKETQKLRGHGQ